MSSAIGVLERRQIDYDPAMRSGRLNSRQRQVLATIDHATVSGRSWVSGYDVFMSMQATSRFGGANHGRVFNTLRSLSEKQYVRVRIETVNGAGKRATYRLTDLRASEIGKLVGAG